ncbi:MAG TPA: heparin lyase I family protein [Microvirga sp.]|jgi:Ca2+-binding RTX toxin-like protein
MTYFENGTFELHSEHQPWSYRTDGSNARFEVRSGDNWAYDGSARERSEIASYKKFAYNQTYTVQYKFMVEPGAVNTADWLLIGQVHQTEDPGEMGVSPPVAIEMTGDHMRVVARDTTQAMTTTWPNTKTLWTDAAPLQRGQWYDLKLEFKFDPYGAGMLNVWRDGSQVVQYNGPLGYNDKIGPYWKHGVYREASPETFAINYADFSLVTGTTAAPPAPQPDPVAAPQPAPIVVADPVTDAIDPVPTTGQLLGSNGADIMESRSSTDSLRGLLGNDTYNVRYSTVQVVEQASEGDDTVNATVSFTLPAHLENLMLLGSSAIRGTGNSLANIINGNESANTISGGGGADTLRGNGGDDVLRGGSGSDYLSGGNGNDTIDGGAGADVAYGGSGSDTFVFSVTPDGVTNVDFIGNYNPAEDTIQLAASAFADIGPAGALNPDAFVNGRGARDAEDRVIYNSSSGKLFFDADGTGATKAVLVAQLSPGLGMSAADFMVI